MEASEYFRSLQPVDLTGLEERSGAEIIQFLSPEEQAQWSQQKALDALPAYDVQVVRRREYRAPETTAYGTFHQESVRYSDGAVRLVTIGTPKQPCGDEVIVSGDPWLTGPVGFNKVEIDMLVGLGFHVVWNHHHGRHAALPTTPDRMKTMLHFLSSKSVGKSAAQDHALLDHLAPNAPFRTDQVLRKGYSRSAMAGEAFVALAEKTTDRRVVWSDHEAACFARGVGVTGLAGIVARQSLSEAKTVLGIAKHVVTPRSDDSLLDRLAAYRGTFDVHPLNAAHELAWIKLLVSGDAGVHARALPLDARGIRTIYKDDEMSQQFDWQEIFKFHQNIGFIVEKGSHLSGASPEMLAVKTERYRRAAQFMLEHGSVAAMTPADVLPTK